MVIWGEIVAESVKEIYIAEFFLTNLPYFFCIVGTKIDSVQWIIYVKWNDDITRLLANHWLQ